MRETAPTAGACGPFAPAEILRLVLQLLQDMGCSDSFETLRTESGVELEAPLVAALRTAVLEGQWAEAERILAADADAAETTQIPAPSGSLEYVYYLMFVQHYLELLEARAVTDALRVLRERIVPLEPPPERLRALSSLVLCRDAAEVRTRAVWDGAGGTSRAQLLTEIEQHVGTNAMLPSHRLITLLEQAMAFQRMQDPFYVTQLHASSPSLLRDHRADPHDFPRQNTHVLAHPAGEVWTLRFSPDGKRLASGDKEGRVIVWDVMKDFLALAQFEHRDGITSIDWSADSQRLLVAAEEDITVWNIDTHNGFVCAEHDYTVSSVRWVPPQHPKRVAFVSGAMDCALIFWHEDGTVAQCLNLAPYRITSLDVTPDGRHLVVLGWSPPPVQKGARRQIDSPPRRRRRRITRPLTPPLGASRTILPHESRPFGPGAARSSFMASLMLPAALASAHSPPLDEDEEFTSLLPLADNNGHPEDTPSHRHAAAEPGQRSASDTDGPAHNTNMAEGKRQGIFLYDLDTQREIDSLYVPTKMDHVSVSPDSRFALLSEAGGNVCQLDLTTRTFLQSFHGRCAHDYVIRASFGGEGNRFARQLGPSFVASGSEDSRICVWHRVSGQVLDTDCRHAHGAVNDVVWHSAQADMMASCGDDGTVRVWQPQSKVTATDTPVVRQAHAATVVKAPEHRCGSRAQRAWMCNEAKMDEDPPPNSRPSPQSSDDLPFEAESPEAIARSLITSDAHPTVLPWYFFGSHQQDATR
mgnify:CR=1 FL=1